MCVLRRARAFVMATVVVCEACKGGAPTRSDPNSDTVTAADDVLARVGDHTITVATYRAVLDHMDEFDRARYASSDRRKELLGEMIDIILLADEAHARGYDQDPTTLQEVREILRDAVLKDARQGAPTPNAIAADQVRAYYNAHRSDFHDPERRRASVIILSNPSSAESALDALRKNGDAAWGDLVRTRSIDPAAQAEVPPELAGDIGFVSPPGDPRGDNTRIPPEVRSALFEIPRVGEVCPHVVTARTPAGSQFYVVKLASKVDAHDRSLTDAERSIRVKLAQDAAHARESALLETLLTQYPVQVDEAALSQVRIPEEAGGQ